MAFKPNYIGYGSKPPSITWPNNARICISFVINYEEGGESNILNGDSHSESDLTEIPSTKPLPNSRNLVVESCYEYGSRVGIYRLLSTFKKYNIQTTIFAVGLALRKNPKICEYFIKNNHEIATHHDRWLNYCNKSYKNEFNDLNNVILTHNKLCKYKPKGIYVGSYNINSMKIIKQFNNFVYCNDYYNDDIPYWINNKLLVIPYSLDTNDFRYLLNNGYVTSEQFFQYLKNTFDVLYKEGGKMMSIGLHGRISGHPGRIMGLIKFLEYINMDQFKNNIWIARRQDIYSFWKNNYPFSWQQKNYVSLNSKL